MKKRDKIIIIVVAVVAVLVVGRLLLPPDGGARRHTLDGKITWIDYETRTASLEFENPRRGTLDETTREIPDDCEIWIDGEAAQLSDLRAGDEVVIEGMHNRRTKEVRVLSITVVERTSAESEPSEGIDPAPALME